MEQWKGAMARFKDLAGTRFGRLVVLRRVANHGDRVQYECICDCGTICVTRANSLTIGDTKSCGCIVKEVFHRTKHGMARANNRHPLFSLWSHMRDRSNPLNAEKYPRYAGRGIFMCDRWRNDFAMFVADIGERPSPQHSVDRINNDKGYEPGNCRWATPKEQANNRAKRQVKRAAT